MEICSEIPRAITLVDRIYVLFEHAPRLDRVGWQRCNPILAGVRRQPGTSNGGGGDTDLRVRCHTKGLRVFVDGRDSGVRCPADYKRIHTTPGEHAVAIVRSTGGAPVSQHTVKVHPQNKGTRVYFKD